ncbi:MAG: ATP-dependent DNA helicase RecG [Synergistaceae bacterium]|nr:ATP-dependent DNA helicase RecG [Synergistaceae bacterium]
MTGDIYRPVTNIKGIGPGRARLLEKLGIFTINDALWFFPRKYVDRREIRKISELRENESSVVIARIISVSSKRSFRSGTYICLCEAKDGTGTVSIVWFNRKGLDNILKQGTPIAISGHPSFGNGKIEFSNPDFEVLKNSSDVDKFTGIVPVYPSTSGLSARWLQTLMSRILEENIPLVSEYIPDSIIEKRGLLGIREAIIGMHRPDSEEHWQASRKRLAYEEFYFLQISLILRRERLKKSNEAAKIKPTGSSFLKFIESLPFELTDSQKAVFTQVFKDTKDGHPMSRLLQGDVGSGKTVIALGLAAAGADAGIQTAVMAPTEILAEQLYSQAQKLLHHAGITSVLLKGGQGRPERIHLIRSIKTGQAQVVVGTHAMIQEGVEFDNLGIVIIDEQQRFGVMQRGEMLSRGKNPHLLMMSATPIPRTVAVCLFGDMDVSFITEKPEGRKKIETRLIDLTKIRDLMQFIINESAAGGRVYWICPRVEDDMADQLVSVGKRYAFLKKHLGPLGIGYIHGQMSGNDKNSELGKFRDGTTKVLVGTTVLEVGLDVPEASVVVIESPERYGLSQLHQLRGRIGRGFRRGVCVLFVNKTGDDVAERLKVMLKVSDGFKIAEADFLLRGPGKILGLKQHGAAGFKVADIFRDSELLKYAKEDAEWLISHSTFLLNDPEFMKKLYVFQKNDFKVSFDA